MMVIQILMCIFENDKNILYHYHRNADYNT